MVIPRVLAMVPLAVTRSRPPVRLMLPGVAEAGAVPRLASPATTIVPAATVVEPA
jgi:hypothetical protein